MAELWRGDGEAMPWCSCLFPCAAAARRRAHTPACSATTATATATAVAARIAIFDSALRAHTSRVTRALRARACVRVTHAAMRNATRAYKARSRTLDMYAADRRLLRSLVCVCALCLSRQSTRMHAIWAQVPVRQRARCAERDVACVVCALRAGRCSSGRRALRACPALRVTWCVCTW